MRSRVISVILSGNLTDGTRGLQAVKQAGGTTIIQNPLEAAYPQQMRGAAKLGLLPTNPDIDMANVSQHIQEVIRRVAESEQVYTEGVTVRFGAVSFASAQELVLNGERITSRNVLIATGSRPLVPRIEGLEEVGYLTNEGAFDLQRLSASLIVVGGGPIGVELGQAFARLGTKVTILEGLERILPREEPEVSAALAGVLQSEQMVSHDAPLSS